MQVFFNLVNGSDSIPDEVGREAAYLEEARSQALAAIKESRRDDPASFEEWQGWRLAAVDQAGRLLFSIDLQAFI